MKRYHIFIGIASSSDDTKTENDKQKILNDMNTSITKLGYHEKRTQTKNLNKKTLTFSFCL